MAGITEIGVRISLEGAQQTTQGLQQTAQGAERLGASLGKLGPGSAQAANTLNLVGISAGQAAQAMRVLPAQITDIVTGLASGQAPLMVLIQQGGQLRDSFGSVGNVLKALGSVISPAVVGLGGAAAAVAALAYGIKGGQAEIDAYNRALVLTGNAAGTTAGQLGDLAAAVGATVGGQARAAAALAQLAATGSSIGVGLDKAAEAAVRLERVGGPAVAQTVKAFADLAKDPLQASVRLNESTNFLTASLYRQIKALVEQGKVTEAAAVASAAFAETSISRTKEIETGLGSIETGWLAVTKAIEGAKNALLSIGRPDSLSDQLAQEQAKLDEVQRSRTVGRNAGRRQSTFDAEEAAIKQRIESLRLLIYQQGEVAAAEAARASGVKKVIKADEGAAAAARAAAAEQGKTAALLAELNGLNADYAEDLQRLQRLRAAGVLTEERYVQAVTALIAKQPFARALAQQTAQAERERAQALEQGVRAQAAYLADLDRSLASADKQLAAMRDEIALLTEGEAGRERLIQARLDDAAAQAAQNLQAAEAAGVGEAEYARLSALADKLAEVAATRRELASATANKEAADANAKAAADASALWQDVIGDVRTALTDAFRRAFESGESFGRAFGRVIEAELKARVASGLSLLIVDGALQLAGLAAGGGSAGAAGRGAGAGTVLQGASTLQNLYSLYNGGGGGLTGSLAALNYANVYSGAAYGTAFGSQQSAMLAAQEAGMVNASTASWGSWAGWAALIYLGYQKAARDYEEGFRSEGARQLQDDLGGGEFGYLLGGITADISNLGKKFGLNDKWADLLSGATGVAKLFGRSTPRVDAQGVVGTLAAGDFAGQAFADVLQKGGLFRSDKRWTELAAVPDDLGRFLDDAAARVYASAREFGAALGLPAEQLANVTTDIRVVLTEDGEANLKAISEALAQYGDALVNTFADAVAPLAQYGETAAQTIARVGGAIIGVNQVLESLGVTALQASVQGGAAAIALQDLFGGLQGLQQAAGGYLANFYSDAERAGLTIKAIGQVLAEVGIGSVPATRDAFRDLVDAQDLTTDAGRRAFATLMSVADAFAAVTEAGRSAADIANERAGLMLALWRETGNEQAIRDFERSQLDPSNQALYDDIQAERTRKAEAEAAARAAEEAAAQQAEADRLRQEAANAASAAWAAAEAAAFEAASVAARSWQEATDTIRAEIDRLRGINRSSAGSLAGAEAAFAITTAQARAGDVGAAQRLPELSKAYEAAAEAMAESATELRIIRARLAASLSETLRVNRIDVNAPGFAAGGYHAGGARWVGESGPELEVTGASRIYPLADVMGGGGMADQLRAMREENAATRRFTEDALLTIARNTRLTAETIDDVARGRQSLAIRDEAP